MSGKKEKKPVQPQDLFRLKFLQEAALSPDGKKAVYTVTHVDAEKEEEFCTLWLVDIQSGKSRPLTSGAYVDTSPAWSPDGKQVAFLSSRTEKPQIHLISISGGEATALTHLKQGVSGAPCWSPDGKWIAFCAGPENPPDYTKPYRVTRKIYRMDGVGYVDGVVQDVYLVPSKGGEVRRLTDDLNNNDTLHWSPDSSEILFLASIKPDRYEFYTDVRVVNLDGNTRDLLVDWGGIQGITWMPDGKRILFSGFPYTRRIGSRTGLFMLDAAGGEPQPLFEDFPGWVNHGVGGDMPARPKAKIFVTSDGTAAYAPAQRGPVVDIFRFDLQTKNEWEAVVSVPERCSFLLDGNDEHLLIGTTDMLHTPDLAVVKLDGTGEKRLTSLNDSVINGWLLPEVEHIIFKGGYGDPVEGWLMKPPGGKAPYPTILYIHGGPQGAYGYIFSFDFHMLAGAGYAVFFCNPRGSTGYTEEFVMQLKARWGDIDYQDVMLGIDHVIEKGLTDPERMGVYGLSYGGYLSSWIITQTDRFKAAVPENPVTDLMTEYGVNDFDPWASPDEFGGKPHEVPDIYWKESPIAFAHQCRTPTLLIQSENDYRCPKNQSEQFYTMLKANGCVVEMVRMPDSFHAASIIGSPMIRRIANEVMLDWFDRYVLNRSLPEHKPSV